MLIYYYLPVSVRNPLYAHKLSLVGFWSLALFYPFVGIHHYLYSPIADWAETIAIVTSMLLIIPVWTVLVNFFGTVMGKWEGFGRNLPAKFLIMGALMYLAGCFQGSLEALRLIQQPTHFTDFVISHSHLTVFGTFVVWAMGGLIYTWPRLCGRELWSWKMGNWSFWLITVGITTMGLVLTAAGLQQGFEWMNGTEWVEPNVQVIPAGPLDVVNNDPVLHNTHGYYGKRTAFNMALPNQGQQIPTELTRAGTVRIDCDAHGWMEGWIYVVDNPYYAITGADGKFSITDVPPGTYTLVAVQSLTGPNQQSVTVASGKPTNSDDRIEEAIGE